MVILLQIMNSNTRTYVIYCLSGFQVPLISDSEQNRLLSIVALMAVKQQLISSLVLCYLIQYGTFNFFSSTFCAIYCIDFQVMYFLKHISRQLSPMSGNWLDLQEMFYHIRVPAEPYIDYESGYHGTGITLTTSSFFPAFTVACSCNVTCTTDYNTSLNCSCSGTVPSSPILLEAECRYTLFSFTGVCFWPCADRFKRSHVYIFMYCKV